MLTQRIGFGAAMIAALVALILLDGALASRSPGAVVLTIIGVLVVLAFRELRTLLTAAGHQAEYVPALLTCLALLAVPHALNSRALTGGVAFDVSVDYRISAVVYFSGVVVSFLTLLRHRRVEGAAAALASTCLVIAYLGLLPPFLLRIRLWAPHSGHWLLLYAVGVVKVSDIGAYFTGRAIGRRKLIPWLSPGKTIEGLAGGVAASTLLAILVTVLVRWLAPDGAGRSFPDWTRAALFGPLMAVLGQAGDLLESLIKRDAGSKDSAEVIPAFGGVLDVLDSLLLTAPVAFWLLVE